MTAFTVFISYCQDSDEHKDRVLHFADRLRNGGIDANLDQYQVAPPEGWLLWMEKQIRDSKYVLLVCTETYLRRVMKEDAGKGLGVMWESTIIYQYLYNTGVVNEKFIPIVFGRENTKYIPTPLQSSTYYDVSTNDGYEALYRRLTDQPYTTKPELGKLKSLPPRERKTDYLGVKISLAKLPSTSSDLFGREKELEELDNAWNNPQITVLTLVAWGGVGKSALVNKWLSQMARDNYRGAQRVFGWSFYSQGAAEGRQVSADQFVAAALEWFGDPDPNLGSPWDKGERLAELVKVSRALLILDGLEPLQNPPPVETGRIKDPALVAFLRELARQNRGLVVITTRLAVDDLKGCIGDTVLERDLENLSPEAGAAYLSQLGVDGTDAERQDAAADFGGHALALTLMGSYLKVVYGGDVRKHHEIPHLTDDQKQGVHARRVLGSYERWLQGKPELDILRLMGLFDRPAEKGALDALRKEPALAGLTDALQKLTDANWKFAVNNLRNLRLVAQENPHEPDTLDCHPLLREHFGQQLKQEYLAAWREGNNRLYEYYKTSAKELPDTLQEMAPLYAAVLHGCQAGKYQEAFDEVFWRRIERGQEYFNLRKFGAFGAELSALSGFFDPPWRKLIGGLRKNDEVVALMVAGFDLQALGRLKDATQPMQIAIDNAIAQKNWINASIQANNLGGLYLTIGDVAQALTYAEQSVQLADRSGNAFDRMDHRTLFAYTLYQAGRLTEAEVAFREAEDMQKKNQPEFLLLYSLPGFRYCDLLLSQGDYADVGRRASQTLEWAKQQQYGGSPLEIALGNLSLGGAQLLHFQRDPNFPITNLPTILNRAVDGLRQAGDQSYLPLGLLARAEFYCVTGALDKAQKDLDEAFSIATRGGMGLFLADCHLEYARLALAKDEGRKTEDGRSWKDEAREHVRVAKEMIAKMGYHRRDKEVDELEGQL